MIIQIEASPKYSVVRDNTTKMCYKLGRFLVLALFTLLLVFFSQRSFAEAKFLARPDVQRYIDEQVKRGRFTRASLEAVLANVEVKPSILAILDRPPTGRPWYLFRSSIVTEAMLSEGVHFWKTHEQVLQRAARIYQVPPEIIVAILGIETRYGKNTGSFRVVDALATLGFDYPRRAQFFRHELTEFLTLAQEEDVSPLLLKGSYAGAMGLPQFMPTSYRRWAVDFDNNGRRDIWSSVDDAIGSVAYYLKQHGWIWGDDILVPANVKPGPSLDALVADKFNLHYTIAELKALGVEAEVPVPSKVKAVVVPLEIKPGQMEYWLGLNNFYVITRYNKSTLYAKAVAEMAQELKIRVISKTYRP